MSREASGPGLLALTQGEPAGIGPDIVIDAWLAREQERLPPFLYLGPAELLERRAAAMGRGVELAEVAVEEAASAFATTLPCLRSAPPVLAGRPGEPDPNDGASVVASIRTAVSLVREGRAAAIVTSPIHKKALSGIGFPFPGHTELLAALSEEVFGEPAQPVMMLAAPPLRVVPVTIHMPLSEVAGSLTTELIVSTGRIVAQELTSRFGVAEPRLAVAGLNPHAGEGGLFGAEDEAVVAPAVARLKDEGIVAFGPLAADAMFHDEARAGYDAALCMYHDQALIPIKTLAFDEAVNVTLGLRFVRTSPDHGTALQLAGTGRARAASLICALKMAADLAAREPAR